MAMLDDIRHYRIPTCEEELMAARISELEGDLSVVKLQLAARVCSECPARDKIAALKESLKQILMEFDFMVERGAIDNVDDDVIFVIAREALAACRVYQRIKDW